MPRSNEKAFAFAFALHACRRNFTIRITHSFQKLPNLDKWTTSAANGSRIMEGSMSNEYIENETWLLICSRPRHTVKHMKRHVAAPASDAYWRN